ncbi:MAG: hypothetical protein K0U78_15305 [Actinomycetia bacterium]|nr:hypothetical protein [Actinomycetes bacterium]
MKLVAHKGQIVIQGKESEKVAILRIESEMILLASEQGFELALVEDATECGEFWTCMSYDSRFTKLSEIREIYKTVKNQKLIQAKVVGA